MKDAIQVRLAAKAKLTPPEGFNLVGVDDFEDPGEELYLVDSFDTRAQAEQAMQVRKASDQDETLHIYGTKDRGGSSGGPMIPPKKPNPMQQQQGRPQPPGNSGQGPAGLAKPAPAAAQGQRPPPGAPPARPPMGAGAQPGAKPGAAAAPPKPAQPGAGKPGMPAQPGPDPDAGSVQYPTKVMNPETGEFEFVYLDDGQRDPAAQFVVSPETAEGAHWEMPHHDEDYGAFKQWKSAKKKGLQGEQIPKELVEGAVRHAEKHHFDGGPHKAAYDDYQAHQGLAGGPQPPPSHPSAKQVGAGQSHPAMQGQPAAGASAQKPGIPPKKDGRDLIGKLTDIVEGGIPGGASRNGMEYATTESVRDDEEEYQSLYGLRRGGDLIDGLERIATGGRASADDFRKGLYDFDLTGRANVAPVPTKLLHDYLCAFVEDAYKSGACEPQQLVQALVKYIPKNTYLARAANKFDCSAEGLAKLLKTTGISRPVSEVSSEDNWGQDMAGIAAMGGTAGGEVLMASDAKFNFNQDPEAVRELTLRKGPQMVRFDEQSGIADMSQLAHHARVRGNYDGDQLVKANFDASCLLHGDIHKQQISHTSTVAKCSCPR